MQVGWGNLIWWGPTSPLQEVGIGWASTSLPTQPINSVIQGEKASKYPACSAKTLFSFLLEWY